MKRRQLIRYAGASLLAATGTAWASGFERYEAQTPKGDSLLIQGLGHSCFLLTSKRWRILVNPFRAIGCTAGYPLPKVEADLVLISSQLWDEGAAENLPGNPKVLFEPGVYNINGLRIQGISIAHDRQGGRRFGTNVAWRWNQAGIRILHLGGAAAPIEIEQRILMGSPDVALIPVGGGAKVYTPEEAKQVIEALNPKIVIPTQYQTAAADKSACDLLPLSDFLKVVEGMNISQLKGDSLRLVPANLPKEGTLIRVFNAQAALKS